MRKITLVSCAVIISLLTGCAQAGKIYPADKKDGVYFSLPKNGFTWKKISQSELAAREALSTSSGAADRAASVLWQEAYSLDPRATASDVLSLKTPSEPLIYVRVRTLLPDEVNSVSYNALRDLVVPLTGWVNGTLKAPIFDLTVDEERVEKSARGVRSVFNFTQQDGTNQTIDQTSLLSNDHSTIYALLIRCSSSCFQKNQKNLETIASSFTVKGKP